VGFGKGEEKEESMGERGMTLHDFRHLPHQDSHTYRPLVALLFFFMLVLGYPQTCYLDSDATIGLYYLYCIIASDFSRLGGSLD